MYRFALGKILRLFVCAENQSDVCITQPFRPCSIRLYRQANLIQLVPFYAVFNLAAEK